ncbi:MAG: hypothetical protein XU15_C0011G0102 [candidate division NC10 bacterium CSP1-5]|nr:MAG: hypothetical protein XU15_C0011G0102 [candidate division NC10 bacterium CSP1-5]
MKLDIPEKIAIWGFVLSMAALIVRIVTSL